MFLSFNLQFFSVYENSIIKTDENQVLRIFENLLFIRESEVSELYTNLFVFKFSFC